MPEHNPELLTDLVVDLETVLKRKQLEPDQKRAEDEEKVSAIMQKLARCGVKSLEGLKHLGFSAEEIELCRGMLGPKKNDTIN